MTGRLPILLERIFRKKEQLELIILPVFTTVRSGLKRKQSGNRDTGFQSCFCILTDPHNPLPSTSIPKGVLPQPG